MNEPENISNITKAKSRKRGLSDKDNGNNNTSRMYKDLIEG